MCRYRAIGSPCQAVFLCLAFLPLSGHGHLRHVVAKCHMIVNSPAHKLRTLCACALDAHMCMSCSLLQAHEARDRQGDNVELWIVIATCHNQQRKHGNHLAFFIVMPIESLTRLLQAVMKSGVIQMICMMEFRKTRYITGSTLVTCMLTVPKCVYNSRFLNHIKAQPAS
jgi:hypothetical protein